jgi:hypothetical protein
LKTLTTKDAKLHEGKPGNAAVRDTLRRAKLESPVKLLRIPFIVAGCVFCIVASLVSSAQDTHFPPADQQIPLPDCAGVAVKDLWFPGSKVCGPNEHAAWLADITHWRNERRIRVGYDGSR